MRFFCGLFNRRGFSIVETLMGAGLMAAAALGFAELAKNSTKSSQGLEARYAKMDVEQSIRSAFMNTSSCACAFSGYTIAAGVVTPITNIKMTDPACSNPRMIIKDDETIPNSTLKVENISVKNVTTFGAGELIGDLHVDWRPAVKGLPMKPTALRNIRFLVNSSGAVTGCGIVPDSTTQPVPCGDGKICFAGKVAYFTNSAGAPITAVIAGSDSAGMLLWFQTPAGRTTMMKFAVNSSTGNLDATRLGTWRPQFCYGHQPNMPYCAQMNIWGANGQPNCAAALYWTYDGHAGNSTSLTSETVTSSGPPIVYAAGTWPYKDTSTLPCSF